MSPLRRLALSTYYHASQRYRSATVKRYAENSAAPMSVLFYHRVANTHPNGWTMSPDSFARQISWLKQNAELISLEEVQKRMVCGNNSERAVSITFDDGYAENCEFALPLLIAAKIPVTYFVSLDFVKTGRAFPHDAEQGQPLAPNTIDQLRELVAAGVEIGAHTNTHPDMSKVEDEDELREETVAATLELGELVGQRIRYFAFPFGQKENVNAEAALMAATEAGIQGVCSAFGAYNLPGRDPFHIRRIHGDPEFTRWRNWVSIDPRKLNQGQQTATELEMGDYILKDGQRIFPYPTCQDVSETESETCERRDRERRDRVGR